MDKDTAIRKAYNQRKKCSEEEFQYEVERLIREIEDTSNKLRDLKGYLTDLEYKEPEIQGGVLTPEEKEDQ